MIARLEEQVGTRLFNRNTRNVSLTPEGSMLVPIARAISSDVTAMYSNLQDHAERRKGKVAIAALPSLCADWLPKILAEYRHRYPGIKVQLFDAIADINTDLVRNGTVDFAINARVENPDEFDTRLLFNERYYFICLPSHKYADRKHVSLNALAGCDYIHTTKAGSVWHWIEAQTRGITFNDTGFEVNQLSTVAGLIAHGHGVSICPEFTLFQFYSLGLRAVPIRDKALLRPLQLVRRRGQSLSVAAKTLLDLIARSRPEHAFKAAPP
jgi:LysR family carnitine catabolism transcriptional activator